MDSKNRELGLDAIPEKFLPHMNIQLGAEKGAGFKLG